MNPVGAWLRREWVVPANRSARYDSPKLTVFAGYWLAHIDIRLQWHRELE